MEGSETALSYQSEESSLLDISCAITEKSFLVNPNSEKNSDFSSSLNSFVSPASTTVDTGEQSKPITVPLSIVMNQSTPSGKMNQPGGSLNMLNGNHHQISGHLDDPDSAIFEEDPTGADRSLLPKSCDKTKSKNCMNAESFQANKHPSSCPPEQKDKGEPTLKKSLDTFYSTCCPKKQFDGNPELASALRHISVKAADLADREGTAYALRSLQVALMVLNRDGNKVFPPHSSGTCFSAAAESNAHLEEGKKIPGLSDDVLQFLLNQKVTK